LDVFFVFIRITRRFEPREQKALKKLPVASFLAFWCADGVPKGEAFGSSSKASATADVSPMAHQHQKDTELVSFFVLIFNAKRGSESHSG